MSLSAAPPHPLWTPFRFLAFLVTPYTPAEKAGMKRTLEWRKDGRGYFEVHSTKPQTIGYALADSPVGLLSWIYEKLVTWTDEYPFTDDEGVCYFSHQCGLHKRPAFSIFYVLVLTWVSIYWFSRAGPAASCRIYYEVQKSNAFSDTTLPTIPKGVSFFPKEIVNLPRA